MEYYPYEKAALGWMIDGEPERSRECIRKLDQDKLNQFSDVLDRLAVMVDNETLRRIPKRTHLSE